MISQRRFLNIGLYMYLHSTSPNQWPPYAKWRARVEMRERRSARIGFRFKDDDERAVERSASARCGTASRLAGVRGGTCGTSARSPVHQRRPSSSPPAAARVSTAMACIDASRSTVVRACFSPGSQMPHRCASTRPPRPLARRHQISRNPPPSPRRRVSAAATSHNSTAIIPHAPGRGAASRYARYLPRCSTPRRAPWRPFC